MDILVVLGTLGSGKTTLINNLLPRLHDRRTLVVVNDIGTVNVDAQRIGAVGDVRALTAGCIGCSDLPAFQAVIRDAAESHAVDLLIIEPTGIADGFEIRDAVSTCGLDCAVITLLDVAHFGRNRALNTLASQLSVSTKILASWLPDGQSVDHLSAPILQDVARFAPGIPVEAFPMNDGAQLLALANDALAQQRRNAPYGYHHQHSNHGAKAYSFRFADHATFADLLTIITPIRHTLLRAKGIIGHTGFDLVQQDVRTWREPSTEPHGTLIGTEPLPATINGIIEKPVTDTRTKKERMRDNAGIPLADTLAAITWQLEQYPPTVGPNGLRVDCEADICYQLSRRPNVPTDIQSAVLEQYLTWRITVARELERQEVFTAGMESMIPSLSPLSIMYGVWDNHPEVGYWRRRIGVNLLYMPAVHRDLIKPETLAAIRELRPAELFLRGLMALSELSCNDELAEERPDIVELCLKWARAELLVSRHDARAVIEHCRRLSETTPWRDRWDNLTV